jgi:predicted acyl esterase
MDNGWETTPHVRSAVLDLGGTDEVDRALDAWPPTTVRELDLHLDSRNGTLNTERPEPGRASHRADGSESTQFTYTFPTDTVIAGNVSARLWMDTDAGDDLDVYLLIEKVSRRGRVLYRNVLPPPVPLLGRALHAGYRRGWLKLGFMFYLGMNGRLRASHRALDPDLSTRRQPRHLHVNPEPVSPGQVVELDIPLTPAVLRWRAGERLRLTVTGRDPRGHWFPSVPPPASINQGRHTVHTGGDRDSVLMLPLLDE